MKVFGDPDTVAIELVVGPAGFCGARLWLAGASVGEPELYGTAGSLAEGLAQFRLRAKARVRPMLFNEPSVACLDIVECAILGPSGSLKESATQSQAYGACLLSPNLCESLDDFLIVTVSDGIQQKVLARSYIDGTLTETILPDGALESAFEAAEDRLHELDSQRV